MELQLGKQKRMMYARVFDRTEEELSLIHI